MQRSGTSRWVVMIGVHPRREELPKGFFSTGARCEPHGLRWRAVGEHIFGRYSLRDERAEYRKKRKNSRIAPITNEGDMPQKKFYRQRAHCNPLSHNDNFSYPVRPDLMDWTDQHYPGWQKYKPSNTSATEVIPTVLDIGCGFGGLTVWLFLLSL